MDEATDEATDEEMDKTEDLIVDIETDTMTETHISSKKAYSNVSSSQETLSPQTPSVPFSQAPFLPQTHLLSQAPLLPQTSLLPQTPLLSQTPSIPSSYTLLQSNWAAGPSVFQPFLTPYNSYHTPSPMPINPYYTPSPMPFNLYHTPPLMPVNSYQTLSPFAPFQFQASQYNSNPLSEMANFLKEIDEKEGTNHYYQNFLNEFEVHQVTVKNLIRLSDDELDRCGVTAIGARRTLCDYAEKYQSLQDRQNFL
ncbi:5461_t:CDS:2 [Dentiscutata heterogama]|uniref:5461_t:CDS:1 n=1 Tax=Dentiscutata heterogama TaxID=1316150 RepID=A0ACA9JWL7_9GLOM|nr:5461_t:CDS:2 [Dentiscutata heterogama]